MAADDGHKVTPASHQNSLIKVAAHWSTPRASDGEKGGPNQSFGAGGEPLVGQATKWATPRVNEAGAYQNSKGDPGKPVLTLDGQSRCFRPDPATGTAGPPSSTDGRQLNPRFVEWLMGWPEGWTMLASGTGSTGYACSATALSRWRRRMRSALSSLASPREAPPEQGSFWG